MKDLADALIASTILDDTYKNQERNAHQLDRYTYNTAVYRHSVYANQ